MNEELIPLQVVKMKQLPTLSLMLTDTSLL